MENLFQSSNNFIWSNLSRLGHGFSGTVYRGMHKESGEAVAVKAFHINANLESRVKEEVELAFLKREFDMLKTLQHKNIVRLLAQETELRSQKDVLIMELCPGGSMLQVIEEPLNSFGLQEAEFICVIKDIAAATQYLHKKNVVHRDMKPGNIVKSFMKDGRVIYKIIDFGAARILLKGQQYQSIHGTASYLHPCLYQSYYAKCLELETECPKSFEANFELWTIGATFYHLATGAVPFRPLRPNAKIMYHMIADKKSGVISAVEHPPGGKANIEWNEELPMTCPFNLGLKSRVTYMLAHMIENDESKMWGFDQFFMYVDAIVSSCPIYVFYVNEAESTTLYLRSDAKLKDLKNEIEIQLKICEAEQLILFHNSPLESIVDSSMEICNYPTTSLSQPLVVFHNKNMTFSCNSNISNQLPENVDLILNSPFTSSNISEGWKNCSHSYLLQRNIQLVCNNCTLLLKVPNSLLCLSKQNVQKLMNEVDLLEQRIKDLHKRIEALDKSVSIVSELSKKCQLDIDLSNIFAMVKELQQKENEVKEKFIFIGTLKNCLFQHHMSELQWNKALKKLDIRIINQCLEDSKTYVRNNQQCFENMKSAKILRILNDNKERMLENMRAFKISKQKLVELYDNITKEFNEWYSGMFTVMTTCRDIENALRPSSELTVAGHLESLSLSIYEVEKQLYESIQPTVSDSSLSDDMASIEIISLPPLPGDISLPQPATSLQNNTTSSSQSGSIAKQASKQNSQNPVLMREIHAKLRELSLSQNKINSLIRNTDSLMERMKEESESLKSKLNNAEKTREAENDKEQ